MNPTSPSASRRWSRAMSRAWIAVSASPLATTIPKIEPPATRASRRCRRCSSRWTRSSSVTSSNPATSLSSPLARPSASGRRSAAIGSAASPVGRPSESQVSRSAGGKHSSLSRPGIALAPGSPETIAASTSPSGRSRRNWRISSFTQRLCAAAGEQSTIRCREHSIAWRISSLKSFDAASSLRSRNTGVSRAGTRNRSTRRPTSAFGTRNFSIAR